MSFAKNFDSSNETLRFAGTSFSEYDQHTSPHYDHCPTKSTPLNQCPYCHTASQQSTYPSPAPSRPVPYPAVVYESGLEPSMTYAQAAGASLNPQTTQALPSQLQQGQSRLRAPRPQTRAVSSLQQSRRQEHFNQRPLAPQAPSNLTWAEVAQRPAQPELRSLEQQSGLVGNQHQFPQNFFYDNAPSANLNTGNGQYHSTSLGPAFPVESPSFQYPDQALPTPTLFNNNSTPRSLPTNNSYYGPESYPYPRDVDRFVQSTVIGDHRGPRGPSANAQAGPSTPLSPGAQSLASSTTTRKSRRNGDELRTQSDEHPHRCSKCRQYYSDENIKKHSSRCDGTQRPHVCNLNGCQMRFQYPKDRKRHQRTAMHRQLPPTPPESFMCPAECCNNKTYSRKDNRDRHVKDKHPELVAGIMSRSNSSQQS